MEWHTSWYILPAAFALDIMLGDPRFLPHPVRWMGLAIERLEPPLRRIRIDLTFSGALLAAVLILGTWLLAFLVLATAHRVHPLFKVVLEVILIYYCISIRSLDDAAMEVKQCLQQNKLQAAREKVAMIVGRDINNYKEEGLARATVETVAENLVDGVTAPLFFAAIGGAPLALAYKMTNTLDSMVGYKNETYREFGRAAARIDDAANYVPARLSVLFIAAAAQLARQKGLAALKIGFRDGRKHTSPNAGYAEAAFAGALEVRLGGPGTYHGARIEKPYLGKEYRAVATDDIPRACRLMVIASLLWMAAVQILYLIIQLM